MARCFHLNCIGQTSVEFLFLFLIMLFYLQVVIQPAVDESSASIIAVNSVGQAKLAAMKLANSINEIGALSGESSKTIWLFSDENTSIWCESDATGNRIKYKVSTGVNLTACGGTECEGEIGLLDDITLSCSSGFENPENWMSPKTRVKISKKDGVINVWIPSS